MKRWKSIKKKKNLFQQCKRIISGEGDMQDIIAVLFKIGTAIFSSILLVFSSIAIIGLLVIGVKHYQDEQQQSSENCAGEEAITSTVNIQTSGDMQKNAKGIYGELVKNGFTSESACALLGVWQLESNLNTKSVNASSGATGLAQWLGPRLTNLQSFAKSKGKEMHDISLQVEFALKEFNDPYYAESKKAMKSKDISGAVKTFVLNYEGLSCDPSQQHLDRRTAYAQNWYGKFKGDKITSSIVSEASNGDNTIAQVDCNPGQGTAWRDKIIEVAKTQSKTQYFLGNPQVWGEKLDCSGLVQGTYERAVNIKLGRNTIAQEKDFREIPKSEAQKGDVCFWGPKGATDHVAIYDGEGGVYEMKDENLDFKHSPLKGYSKGAPTYFATLEGTKLGKQLPKDDEGGTVGGSWCWPSPSHGSFSSEQDFGPRTLAQSPWHDGLDFGSASWPSPKILACHGGKVIFAGDPGTKGIDNSYPNGLGKAVIVVRDGGYNFVYQEFSTSTSAIRVKVGDTVKAGQWIASRNTAHMHLGITKSDWVSAQAKYLTDDGTWLDPQKLIRNGMNKG